MILTPWVIVGIVKSSSFVPPTHMLPGSYYKNYISGGELHRRGRWERRWTCWTCKTWSIQSCFQWLRGEVVSLWVSMSLCLCFKNDFFIHLHETILQIIHHCDICPIFAIPILASLEKNLLWKVSGGREGNVKVWDTRIAKKPVVSVASSSKRLSR